SRVKSKAGRFGFHRLCAQSQSAGECLIISSSRRLILAVKSSVSPSFGGKTGSKMMIFHRARPHVSIAIGRTGALVRIDRVAASVDEEASRPKSGVQSPARPA